MSAALAAMLPTSTRAPAQASASVQAVAAASAPADAAAAAPFLDTLLDELAAAVQQTPPAQPAALPEAAPTDAAPNLPALADGALHMQLAQPMLNASMSTAAAGESAASQPEKETAHEQLPDASALLPLLHNLMAPLAHANVVAQTQAVVARTPDATVHAAAGDAPTARNPQAAMQLATLDTDAANEAGAERRAPVAAVEGAAASLVRVTTSAPAQVQEAVVKLPAGDSAQWRQPLAQALGDRLEVMRSRGADTAVIRLDPPMMGRIDISIRHEAGALKVSISATHGEVLRQLQGIGESLRTDLSQRQFGDVTVQVTDSAASRFAQGDSEGRQRQPQSEQQTPGRALAEAESGHEADAFRLAGDQE